MKNRIKIGDKVTVKFVGISYLLIGTVLYAPLGPDDDWIIRGDDDALVYVHSYETIRYVEFEKTEGE